MDIDSLHSQALANQFTSKVKKEVDPKDEAALMEACEGFEAIFTKTILDSMRDTLPGNGLFKESNGMKIFQSLHDQHLAEQMSQSPHSSGIKEFLFNELKGAL